MASDISESAGKLLSVDNRFDGREELAAGCTTSPVTGSRIVDASGLCIPVYALGPGAMRVPKNHNGASSM